MMFYSSEMQGSGAGLPMTQWNPNLWSSQSYFFLKSGQMQAIIIDPKHPWIKVSDYIINWNGIYLASRLTGRNPGATIDQ